MAKVKRRYAPGTHWTQQPENKAKLARIRKRAAASRAASANGSTAARIVAKAVRRKRPRRAADVVITLSPREAARIIERLLKETV